MFHLSASYTLGLIFILSVSLIWAAASILVQFLYTKESFDSPFLLTYIGVSLFTVLLPTNFALVRINVLCQQFRWKLLGHRTLAELEVSASADLGEYENVPAVPSDTPEEAPVFQEEGAHDNEEGDEPGVSIEPPPKWTNTDHIRAAMKIAPIWFLANWSYNASLAYTSITSSTVLASMGSLFTFLFAVSYKDEQFTCLKFAGVLLGVLGSLLTALHDAGSADATEILEPNLDEENDPLVRLRLVRYLLAMPLVRDGDWSTQDRALFGDALGLISAVGYGAYAVMVRVMCPRDESLMSMELLLGYIGLFNMVALSPVLFYQLSQGNHSQLTWVVFGFLVVKGLLDNVLSDYLWARAVILTSATVATVGLGLTIPFAFISDVMWMGMDGDEVVSFSSVSGALSVLAGFVLVNVATNSNEDEQQSDRESNEEGGNRHQEPVQLTEMKSYTSEDGSTKDE